MPQSIAQHKMGIWKPLLHSPEINFRDWITDNFLKKKKKNSAEALGSTGSPLPMGHPCSFEINKRKDFITSHTHQTKLWRKRHLVFKDLPLTGIERREGKNPTKNPSSDEKDKFSKTVTDTQSRYQRKNATKIRLAQWISTVDSISKPNYSSLFPSHTLLPIIAKSSQPTTHTLPGAWCCQCCSHKPLCWGQWSLHNAGVSIGPLAWDNFPLHKHSCWRLLPTYF